jgi:hypothetical protein
MKNTLIAMSCLVAAAAVACTSSPPRRTIGTTGTAGSTTGTAGSTTGTAGSTTGTAGSTTGTAGDTGTAGATTGTAGAMAGTAGATAGTAGDTGTAGAAGGTAGAGTAGAAGGTAGAGTAGAAGGTAGAGTAGAGGATVMACANSTVVSAGGMESKCTAKTMWVATAMPSPAHRGDIPDTALFPKYAIDGMIATRYSSGATMAPGFYFQVDLGAAKMVSGIIVDTSEGVDAPDVAQGYEVGLSTDGIAFTPVKSCMSAAAPMEVVNFTATMARYVRYTNMGAPPNGATSWMSIHEFDILCN